MSGLEAKTAARQSARAPHVNLSHLALALMSVLAIADDGSLVDVLVVGGSSGRAPSNQHALVRWLETRLLGVDEDDLLGRLPLIIGELLELLEAAEARQDSGTRSREVSHDS